MNANGRSLIAVAPCGCVVAAMSLDMPRRDLEKAAYQWTIVKHLQVRIVDDAYVRDHFIECPHRDKQPALPGMED